MFYLSLDTLPKDLGYPVYLIKILFIYPLYALISSWLLLRMFLGKMPSKNKFILACLNIIFVVCVLKFSFSIQELAGSERLANMVRIPLLNTLWLIYFSASLVDMLKPHILTRKWTLPSLIIPSIILCFSVSPITLKMTLEAIKPTEYKAPLITEMQNVTCKQSFYSVYNEQFAQQHNLPEEFTEPLPENLHYIGLQATDCVPRLKKGIPVKQAIPYETQCFVNALISPQHNIAIKDKRLIDNPEKRAVQIEYAQTAYDSHKYKKFLGAIEYRQDAFDALKETMTLKQVSRSLYSGIPGVRSGSSGISGLLLIPNMVNNLTYISSRFFPCPYNRDVFADSTFTLGTTDTSGNPIEFNIPNRIIKFSQGASD
jgi:hypothetical protein